MIIYEDLRRFIKKFKNIIFPNSTCSLHMVRIDDNAHLINGMVNTNIFIFQFKKLKLFPCNCGNIKTCCLTYIEMNIY